MKPRPSNPTTLVSTILALSSMVLTSCVTNVDLIEVARGQAERRRGPKPEAVWNQSQLWERVADNPPTYIPTGYGRSTPRTETEGTWVVDERDGKRLFAPNVKVGDLEPGVLRGEARKATTWSPREYTSTAPGIMSDGEFMAPGEFLQGLPQSY